MPPSIRTPAAVALAAVLLLPSLAAAQIAPGGLVRDPNAQPILLDPRPRTTLEALPPPPAGPPPQGLRFESAATYGIFARIAWNPAPNATGYQVSRAKRDDATCCNAVSGPLPSTETGWSDVGLFRPGYYRYTITVQYADGSVGTDAIDLVVPKGGAPAPVTAQDIGLARVRIQWNADVPGTCCVKIMGPGLGPAGEKLVRGGPPFDLPILPAGTHTWKVAAAYDVRNLPVQPAVNYGATTQSGVTYVVLAPPSEWAEVSHTVRYGMGRFRISLEGFQAIRVTAEDPFRHDGRGDEVFISTMVSEYGRNGSLRSSRMTRTPTFGDRHNFPERVQAGSASPQGGIMPNDRYPAAAQLVSQLQPVTTNNLPFLLWEGELTEIDNAVILSPAIWESDGGDELFSSFSHFHGLAAPGVAYRDQLSPHIPNSYGRPVLDTWRPQKSCPAPLGPESPPTLFVPAIRGWRDEPMDMNRDHSYCPTFVAINWKIAHDATTVNPAAVLEIPFTNATTNWHYKLFVRIEKAR